MNTNLPFRVLFPPPSRKVYEYCACLADAKRIAKVLLSPGMKPRRVQERQNGKWRTIKVDWTLGFHYWPVARAAHQLSDRT